MLAALAGKLSHARYTVLKIHFLAHLLKHGTEPEVITECVKCAEDSDTLIVRLYEAHNSRVTAHIRIADGFSRAYLTDLMENDIREVDIKDEVVTLPMKNFEISTLRFAK